jgi:hypothetical protein
VDGVDISREYGYHNIVKSYTNEKNYRYSRVELYIEYIRKNKKNYFLNLNEVLIWCIKVCNIYIHPVAIIDSTITDNLEIEIL